MIDPQEFAGRYAAMWNEPDDAARRATIAELFAADGVHILHPPEEARKRADELGMIASFQVRGHAVILYLPKYCILDKKVVALRHQ